MITTQFLEPHEIVDYGHWLKAQDPETIHEYFGCAMTLTGIDSLVEKFSANSQKNHFIVAKINHFWAGTIHIATNGQSVELGVIVANQYRKQGVATLLMDEAITWARNRFYSDLYMHCIYRNVAIKRLCEKHELKLANMMGDTEGNLSLPPPTPLTFFKEQIQISNQNWRRFLRYSQLSF